MQSNIVHFMENASYSRILYATHYHYHHVTLQATYNNYPAPSSWSYLSIYLSKMPHDHHHYGTASYHHHRHQRNISPGGSLMRSWYFWKKTCILKWICFFTEGKNNSFMGNFMEIVHVLYLKIHQKIIIIIIVIKNETTRLIQKTWKVLRKTKKGKFVCLHFLTLFFIASFNWIERRDGKCYYNCDNNIH